MTISGVNARTGAGTVAALKLEEELSAKPFQRTCDHRGAAGTEVQDHHSLEVFRSGFSDYRENRCENYDTFSGCIKDNSISRGFLTFGEDLDPLGNRDKSPVSMNRFKAAMDNAYSKPLILSRMIPIARVELPKAVLTDTSALVIQNILPLINFGVNG
jgi:hypothetical protein